MISLLTPTRGRPQNMERVWNSALTTAKDKDWVEIIFYIANHDIEKNNQFIAEALGPVSSRALGRPASKWKDNACHLFKRRIL